MIVAPHVDEGLELVTKKYKIEDINTAFGEMKNNARGVILFD